MELRRNVIIQCEICGNEIIIDKDDIDYTTSIYERNMGEEILYEFSDTFTCSLCQNPIKFELYGSEYPIGAYNHDSSSIKGGIFLQSPSMTIIYRYDFDDLPIKNIINQIYHIQDNPEYIYNLEPREFEELIAELFISAGYEVTITKETRDGGKDLIVTQHIMGKPVVIFVECKRYHSQNKVNVNVVRSLLGVITDDQVNKGMIVTSSFFTKDAQSFAERQGTLIDLVDYNYIMEWIKDYR